MVWVCNYSIADISGTEGEGSVTLQHELLCVCVYTGCVYDESKQNEKPIEKLRDSDVLMAPITHASLCF